MFYGPNSILSNCFGSELGKQQIIKGVCVISSHFLPLNLIITWLCFLLKPRWNPLLSYSLACYTKFSPLIISNPCSLITSTLDEDDLPLL